MVLFITGGGQSGTARKRRTFTLCSFFAGDRSPAPLAQEDNEQLYCAGGGTENRIKAHLKWFRASPCTETMLTRQFSLCFSSLAYVLSLGLRRLAMAGAEWSSTELETTGCACWISPLVRFFANHPGNKGKSCLKRSASAFAKASISEKNCIVSGQIELHRIRPSTSHISGLR